MVSLPIQKVQLENGDFHIGEFTKNDLQGQLTILYFYPKDDTPGCTIEGCGFRDLNESIDKTKIAIIGVSRDDINSHKKFIVKHDLNFALVSDIHLELAKEFGVMKEKSMFGKKFLTNERSTFVIDNEGKVMKEFRNVNPILHLKELKDYLAKTNLIV